MIHRCGRRPALLVASIAAVVEFALASKQVCLLHGQEVPCPSDISDAAAAAATEATHHNSKHHRSKASAEEKDARFEAALSSNFFQKATTARPTPAPTPLPTPAPTPPPMFTFSAGAGADSGAKQTEQEKKNMIGAMVGGGLGLGAAVAAGAGGIALAIHQSELAKEKKAKESIFAQHPKGTTLAPALSARVASSEVATGNETTGSGSSGSGGSMDHLKPGHGSLGFMKGHSWESSGDFTWLILLSLILLVCIGCLFGMCMSCRSPKKKNVKKAPRAVTVSDLPATSHPSHQEQAPLLQQVGLGGSFPPPPPRGVSGMDPMGTRMDVMPTSTMYNGPAQAGMGGYFPATTGAMSVSPLALETTPALAPPPPPPKPQQYYNQPPPASYQQMQMQQPGTPGAYQQMQTQPPGMPGTYQQMQPPGTYTAGLQTQAPGAPSGRPDLQTMPPQAISQGFGQPTAPTGFAQPTAPTGYSHTQTMQTMPALPKQPGYGYR